MNMNYVSWLENDTMNDFTLDNNNTFDEYLNYSKEGITSMMTQV